MPIDGKPTLQHLYRTTMYVKKTNYAQHFHQLPTGMTKSIPRTGLYLVLHAEKLSRGANKTNCCPTTDVKGKGAACLCAYNSVMSFDRLGWGLDGH